MSGFFSQRIDPGCTIVSGSTRAGGREVFVRLEMGAALAALATIVV